MFFCTLDRSRLAFSAPALKIGRLICGWNSQVPEPPLNSPDRSLLSEPALAVRLMLGKNAARAAPMLALAAFNWCSAWRMSGRRCSRSDGRPAGTSASRLASRSRPCGRSLGRPVPSSRTTAFWSCATRRVYCARVARVLSTEVCAWRKSSAEATPTS
ncbi:hypothetical protein D3C80_1571950 [compost metagenome]